MGPRYKPHAYVSIFAGGTFSFVIQVNRSKTYDTGVSSKMTLRFGCSFYLGLDALSCLSQDPIKTVLRNALLRPHFAAPIRGSVIPAARCSTS
jgi:hypothetical protein